MNKFTLDEIKTRVSIIELIKFRKNLDFILKRDGKNVKAFVPKRNDDGSIVYTDRKPQKKTNLLISRVIPKGKTEEIEVFYNVSSFDKSKPGSVLDFVHIHIFKNQPHSKPDFKLITGLLYQYMESKDFVLLKNSTIDLPVANSSSNKKSDKKVKLQFPNESTFAYLKSRGISAETLRSPVFIGTFGSYTEHNEENEIVINEKPAFPILNLNGKIQTLQWIDFDGERHKGKYLVSNVPRNDALYKSNYLKETNTAIITESPEKCKAHYQLYKPQMDKQKVRPKYYSSLGYFTLNDLKHLIQDCNRNQIKNKIFAFDNDIKGLRYTFASFVYLNGLDVDFKMDESKNNTLDISIQTKDFQGDKYNYDKTRKILNIKQITFIDNKDGSLTFNLPQTQLINKLKSKDFNIHLSITNDFLDEIKHYRLNLK
jgi:hypothetical protein